MLSLIIFVPCVSTLLQVITGSSNSLFSVPLYLFLFYIGIIANKSKNIKYWKFITAFMMIDISLWLYSCVININSIDTVLLRMLKQHFGCVVPIFYVASNIRDFEMFEKYLILFSKFFSILFFLMYIIFGKLSILDSYDMSLGYVLVTLSIILLASTFKRFNSISLILACVDLFFALSFGSRGIIVVLCSCILLCIYFSKRKIKIYSVCIVTTVTILFVSLSLMGVFEDSRTIRLVTNPDTLLYLSGRDRIFNGLEPYLFNAPLLGNGIGADRIVMGDYGLYAHNVFLELLVSVGLLITIIIIAIGYSFVFRFLKGSFNLALIVFFSLYLPLLFTWSIWTAPNAWILLGLLCSNKLTQIKVNS